MATCYKSNVSPITACGRLRLRTGGTTDDLRKVTCPYCKAALAHRAQRRKEAKR